MNFLQFFVKLDKTGCILSAEYLKFLKKIFRQN